MDEDFEQPTFSINEIIDKDNEQKDSFINDTTNIIELLFNQYSSNERNSIIYQSLSMVFELFNEMIKPLYSLINDQMMPNIFELYQMTEDLRYYFALFNGDLKMKLKDIKIENSNNQHHQQIKELISKLYNSDRPSINRDEFPLNLNKLSIKEDKEEDKETQQQQQPNLSFFSLFQIFTSIVYNLQSNCEKLLLQSIETTRTTEVDIKKQLFNHLIKRDLLYLENTISKLNYVNQLQQGNGENKWESFKQLLEGQTNKIETINDEENFQQQNLLESFQTIFSNYIEKNKLNVDLILESFN